MSVNRSKKRNPTLILASLSVNVIEHLRKEVKKHVQRHICTVAREKTIPTRLQAPVLMRTEGRMTYVLQPVERTTNKTEPLVTNRLIDVAPNHCFLILVACITNSPTLVQNHTKLSRLAERPTMIVNMIDDISTKTPDDSVNAVSINN